MVLLSPPNSNGLALSTFQARTKTNPPLTRALAVGAGATELVLRRSWCCDGAGAATELVRGAAMELRSSSYIALIPRVASERRDAQNDETSIG